MHVENDEYVYCKLFNKEIAVGLCIEIGAVSCRMLKKDAVREINDYSREEIEKACENCPYA